MADTRTDQTLADAKRPLRLTKAGLWAERITRSFWPAWTVGFVGLAVWSFDLVAPLWEWSLLAALTVIALVLTVVGLRNFRTPTRDDAIDRLDGTLPGRPLTSLTDTQAIGSGDTASQAVWAAHQRRMKDRLSSAKAVPPDLRLSRRDPFALRYFGVLLAALGLTFGTFLRVPEAPALAGPAAQLSTGPAWEGWLEPPRHTGLPTLSLAELDRGAVEVPEGTRVTIRLYGEVGALSVTETVSGRDQTIPVAPIQDFVVTQSGTLSIDGGDDAPLWTLTATPDTAPQISLNGEPGFDHPDQVTVPWQASDDYGLVGATITFALDMDATDRRHGLSARPEPREPLTLDVSLPIAGSREEIAEIFRADLTKHPLAGMPVTATMAAVDASDQTGQSVDTYVLPGRAFYDPVAAALIEQRRDLYWSRDNQARVQRILRAITWRADDTFDAPSAFLITRMAIRRLDGALLTPEVRDEVAEMLWQAAVRLEENSLDSALERLRQAQERLSEAIRQGADPEEIARLMDEMRDAMDDYTRQLAQQQGQQGQQQQQAQGEMQEVSPDMLDQMMQRIEELMEQGRTAEAQELLRQLQEMMENMQVTQGQPGQGGQGQQGEGQQAMEELRDQLREQQGLSDDAFRELQEQFNPDAQAGESAQNEGRSGGQGRGQEHTQQGQGQQGESQQPGQGQQGQQQAQRPGSGQGQPQGQQPGQQQGQSNQQGSGAQDQPGAEPDPRSLAQRQEALRQQLEQLRDNLPGAGSERGDAARDALGRAERAMREAERDLADGNLSGALDDQSRAMDALRDGLQELGRALAESQGQPGENQNQGQAAQREGNGFQRDPLGRQSGEGGQLSTNENLLGGPDAARRAQDLMDEIRRRSGQNNRPKVERDYLRRLLDRF